MVLSVTNNALQGSTQTKVQESAKLFLMLPHDKRAEFSQ